MKKILIIFGTRPEAIKLAPVIKEFKKYPALFDTKVCVTAQHRQMLDQVLDFFQITPDYDLDIMKEKQTLFDVTINSLKGIEQVLDNFKADVVFIQGDTTTAFVGSLAAFYKNTKVAHIEAGLRSGSKHAPFPEEVNRILAGHIADFHFAPTEQAKTNLSNENIHENVFVVKNTVVDALQLGLDIIMQGGHNKYSEFFGFLDFSKRIILVTGHRRESFGIGFENICNSLLKIAEKHKDVVIVYPVHLNPSVRKTVFRLLGDTERIHIINPLDYPYLIWLLSRCFFVITDSGGIQEEAPSLGKPVLVIRDVTERMEGVHAGTAKLVGTSALNIYSKAHCLLTNPEEYNRMSKAHNPYGDGLASKRIVEFFVKNYSV